MPNNSFETVTIITDSIIFNYGRFVVVQFYCECFSSYFMYNLSWKILKTKMFFQILGGETTDKVHYDKIINNHY